ncbi:hypothetical protein HYP06_gp049 [Vibrio phage vB_VspP_pVa5]|uniref:Uncharacterized protein n=1 Tax=Vibrio phage vB_VspP_pVa5 TaxID=1913109 RepID=A0A1J0GV80_9CAUD|nr:hypothetical protein HYP06_gp049 [Vibrio phage vB_VspP_pVa5]APC46084.1 hypothetical protein vBVspPpVa5_0049 [Vibrio phage vB_VspP_pVa5]
MSKLTVLLASQKKLTEEVALLDALLNEAEATQLITVGSRTVSLVVERKDAAVGQAIMTVFETEFQRLTGELEATNRKVAALEELIG